MFLFDQAEKHECKKGKKKKREMIFWASLQRSGDLFHHLLWLLASVFRAEVPRSQPRTLSLALASSLRSIVKAGADGFQCSSKNKNYHWCGGTSCSQHLIRHHLYLSLCHASGYCLYLHFHYLIKLLNLAIPVHSCRFYFSFWIPSTFKKNSISSCLSFSLAVYSALS